VKEFAGWVNLQVLPTVVIIIVVGF
jgi:hypothetical protein